MAISDTPTSAPSAGRHEKGEERDLYQVLQVDPLASREIIAEAYWVLVRKAQAHRTQDHTAGEVLQQLNVAYATLVNPDLRLSYSRTLPPDRQHGPRSVPEDGQRRRRPLRQRLLGRRHLPDGRKWRNLYRILLVDPRAEQEIIAAAYACLRQQYREGIWNGQTDEEALDELTEAFSVLADPEQRISYDDNFPGLRREEEPTPEPSPPAVTDDRGTAPTASGANEDAVGQPAAGAAALTSAVDWAVLSRKLVRFLGRSLVIAGRGARLIGTQLYLGSRWLVIVIVVPAVLWLWAATRNRVEALLNWAEPPPTTGPPADVDQAVRGRLTANSTPLTQAPTSAEPQEDSEQAEVPIANLVICGGPHAGSTFLVTDRPISLGADPLCDVLLEAQAGEVAPLHARIWYREGRFMIHQIADCDSIAVNGKPLIWGILEDGDELRIGPHQMTFELTPPNEPVDRTQPEDGSGTTKP